MATQLDAVAVDPNDDADAGQTDNNINLYADDTPQSDLGEEQPQPEEDGDNQPEPELPPIEAPNSLTAEEKEKWGGLPREAQEMFTRRVGELEKGLHAKTQEFSQQRRQIEDTARTAVMQVHEAHAEQLEGFLSQQLPPRPDPLLLQTGQEEHRSLFYQQQGSYEAAVAQRQEAQQRLQAVKQQSAQLEQAQLQAQRQADEQVLVERLGTEWTDPSARQKLLGELQPIGGELGYPVELMAEANATDILALKMAAEWKRDADKWRAANKAKMEVVRAAKQLPNTVKPGNAQGSRAAQPNDAAALLYPNDVRR